MSIADLEQLQRDVGALIEQKRQQPTELDIAIEHCHHPDLLHEIVRTKTRERSTARSELRRIYCSPERCPRCSHGPYLYSVRPNKRRGTESVRFVGKPAFSEEELERLARQVKPPIAVFKYAGRRANRGKKEG